MLLGGEIWANVKHRISHVGPFDFAIRYQGIMESNEANAEALAEAMKEKQEAA